MYKSIKIENKKVYHDYFVEDTLQCGISLRGNEVKSIRDGKCSIKEAWVQIQDGQLVLRGMHIAKWVTANNFDVDETRERILLANKKEIRKLEESVKEDGVTLKPVSVYFSVNGKCKVLIGVCRGKHNYDKREVLKSKQVKLDINRAFKEVNK